MVMLVMLVNLDGKPFSLTIWAFFFLFKSCLLMLPFQAVILLNKLLGKVNQSAAQEQQKYGS